MSETMTEPTAGWYPDPSSQAPYRWWDGQRWSTRTRIDAPATAARTATAVAELPRRRTLRDTGPVSATVTVTAAAHPAVLPAAAASTAPASPIDLQPAYVPLNPLGGRQPVASPPTPDWHTPESWIANSPSGHHFDHAVYPTGAPFVSTVVPAPTPSSTNALANLGAGFALIGLLYQGVIVVWGPSTATSWTGLAVAAALVVGVALGIAGLVRARQFTTATGRPRRAGAVLVLLVSLAALGAQSSVATSSGLIPAHDPLGLIPAAAPAAHAAVPAPVAPAPGAPRASTGTAPR